MAGVDRLDIRGVTQESDIILQPELVNLRTQRLFVLGVLRECITEHIDLDVNASGNQPGDSVHQHRLALLGVDTSGNDNSVRVGNLERLGGNGNTVVDDLAAALDR